MSDNDTPRAEHVIPPGFRPTTRWPHVVDLDAQTSTDDEPMIVAQGDLRNTAEALGSMRVLAALLEDGPHAGIARQLGDMAGFWQRHVRLIAGIGLALLMAVGVLAAGVVSPAPAAAAEGPEPNPVATVRVVLDRAVVTVSLRVTVRTKYGRRYCASAWSAQGFLGRACSRRATLIVPARVDAKALPLGLSQVAVTDDGDPLGMVPQTFTLDARRPSRFGVGTYTDLGSGDEFISASISMYSPAAGRWLPQSQAPVYVQESTRRGWRTRVVLTSHQGVAAGVAHLGGGAHVLRLVRPEGATVTATTGTTRLVNVTTEPLDIV